MALWHVTFREESAVCGSTLVSSHEVCRQCNQKQYTQVKAHNYSAIRNVTLRQRHTTTQITTNFFKHSTSLKTGTRLHRKRVT
jgi:uncharacterized OB-fold protein